MTTVTVRASRPYEVTIGRGLLDTVGWQAAGQWKGCLLYTSFLFVTHPRIDGARLYQKCRERGILIRHFSDPDIAQYNRVTIGAEEEMETFLTVVRDILREEGL